MRVRYRVDGVLSETTQIPKRMNAGVVSRIKIMADLDIAERRLPQDGRVSLRVEGHAIDIRVVTIPGVWGEGIVMRILDKEQVLLSMDTLGIARRLADPLQRCDPAVLRRDPRDRPDGLGQVHHALRGAERDQLAGEEHPHDRGPGRVPARGDQPDPGQPEGGPRLRPGPALDAARRPRHHHGRRDPRRRDRADRGRVRPHGAPRPLDASHERRAVGDHPSDRDGDRAVPHGVGGGLHRRPAARAQAVHALQEARRPQPGVARGGRLPRGPRRRGVRARRLPALQRHRLQGPDRRLRGHDALRGDPRHDDRAHVRRRRSATWRSRRG